MNISARDSIRIAIAYADIFDFPLTKKEAVLWRVGRSGGIAFSLPSYSASKLALRKRRAHYSSAKWNVAHKAAHILKKVPGILLVGVTGGVAMENADKQDDIDFLIITATGTMWASRLCATILLTLAGVRRRPDERQVANKICLNMFMQEGDLSLPVSERDLFSAHEVLQMVPLWERNGVYKKFLRANIWVKQFLPNAWREKQKVSPESIAKNNTFLLRMLEFGAKHIQLRYMKRRQTSEVITKNQLRFHPRDVRPWVKKELAYRLRSFGIPLDRIFYGR